MGWVSNSDLVATSAQVTHDNALCSCTGLNKIIYKNYEYWLYGRYWVLKQRVFLKILRVYNFIDNILYIHTPILYMCVFGSNEQILKHTVYLSTKITLITLKE